MKTSWTFESEFGEFTIDGRTYIMQSDATISNSVQPHNFNYNDVETGEEYELIMTAPATRFGKEYIIVWCFTDIKGSEAELDSYDYDDVYSIEEV